MRPIHMAGEEDLQPINLKISIYLESLNTERPSRYMNLMKERLQKKMEQQVKKQKSKSRSKAKEILTNNSKIIATATSVPLTVGAYGILVGSATPFLASQTNSFIQSSVHRGFENLTGSGLMSTIMNPISNGLSSVLGNTAEAAITIATPIAVLYFVPTLFRLFFYVSKKMVHLLANLFDSTESHSLNSEYFESGLPLLTLLCNLSTLAIIDDLTLRLKAVGIEKISINLIKLKNKILNKENSNLNVEEKMLYDLAKKNSEKLIALSLKIGEEKIFKRIQSLESVTSLKAQIQKFIPKVDMWANGKIDFWITVMGALIDKESVQARETFFNTLQSISTLKTPNAPNPHSLFQLDMEPRHKQREKFSPTDQPTYGRQAF
ncbi:CBU_1819 family Dot/Icm T4SS effector [Coxiella burnetii]|uniref:CBU_1819 family Dot/Icm T4SS effector n=1 Tax=Coxiella burnetii TaxID=777 RepID=UPI0002D31581|nr:CBU_1819 family Dot/Icm T4SS effector [Coxiella burnetii]ATN82801.1 hypothetical protein AYO24_09370 [Coxiella burnetii]ATN84705.1 hypothetical protein AYO23_09370 [Coxiella burnetii]POZ75207.1 hypothetical protein CbuRSA461_09695 [Coxiella burnetii]